MIGPGEGDSNRRWDNILGGGGRLDQGKHMIIAFRMPSKLAIPADDGIGRASPSVSFYAHTHHPSQNYEYSS